MHYEGTVIRPPSEAQSIILQVTVGCSHNRCTFCGAYKDVQFSIKDEATVDQDIEFAAKNCKNQSRLFLADGDVLILSQHRLERIFHKIRAKLPHVKRISLYASARAIRNKSLENLFTLKRLGLDRIYLGLESGDNDVLTAIDKGEDYESLAESGERVAAAGIFLSTTVLLGIAGVSRSLKHATRTAALLNRIQPDQIAALTYMPLDNTLLGREVENGSFQLLTPVQILHELYQLISELAIFRCQFMANHASNYLLLSGRFPRDKERMIIQIQDTINGNSPLIPEYRRAL